MNDDYSGAHQHASQYEGGSDDDSRMFQHATSQLGQYKQQMGNPEIDENEMVQHHQNFYGGGGPPASGNVNSGSMGSAAAMQALKKFSGGGGQSGNSMPQGGAQNQYIGMAMQEASKLFDKQSAAGNVVSDD